MNKLFKASSLLVVFALGFTVPAAQAMFTPLVTAGRGILAGTKRTVGPTVPKKTSGNWAWLNFWPKKATGQPSSTPKALGVSKSNKELIVSKQQLRKENAVKLWQRLQKYGEQERELYAQSREGRRALSDLHKNKALSVITKPHRFQKISTYRNFQAKGSWNNQFFTQKAKKFCWSLLASVMGLGFFSWIFSEQDEKKDAEPKEQERALTPEERSNFQDERDNALFDAVNVGDCQEAQKLLESGANPNSLYCVGSFCRPLLCDAILRDNIDMVMLLLQHGADPDAKDTRGKPIIFYVLEKGNQATLTTLINHETIDLDQNNGDGLTPLLYATQNKKNDLVKLLLKTDKLVNVDAADRWGFNVLYFATAKAEQPDFEVITLLLERGAQTSGFSVRADDNTQPYQTSILIECVRKFLMAKFDGALTEESKKNKLKVLKFFLDRASKQELERVINFDDIFKRWMPQDKQKEYSKSLRALHWALWSVFGNEARVIGLCTSTVASTFIAPEVSEYAQRRWSELEKALYTEPV
ncbi:MAG: ankyrin repeat domain-containing protein [Epsilonproteobacteria bacterium]|nr:ankyrin repeat domain-containing protein [Campylobacterota bacterium]